MTAAQDTTPTSGRLGRARLVDAALLFALSWLWLDRRPPAPIHGDTSRDLAYARDLADGAWLHLRGATAHFRGLAQGSAWIDFLALCERAGLGPAATEGLLTTLLALSVALVHVGCVRVLPLPSTPTAARLAPVAAAIAWLAALPFVCEVPISWQPLLLPAPLILAHVAAWRVLRWGQLSDVLALAVLTSLAVDIHVVAAAFALLTLAAVPLAARRPWVATPAFIAVAGATSALCSWTAVEINAVIAVEHGWWLAPLAALALGVGARRLGALGSGEARLRAFTAVELGLAGALALASLAPSTPALAGRYLAPFAPALALAIAIAIARSSARGPRWLGPGLGCGLALVALVASHARLTPTDHRELPTYPVWTATELEPIAAELVAREQTWTELVLALQGPDFIGVLGHLASIVEPGDPDPDPPRAGLLLVGIPEAEVAAIRAEVSARRPPLRSAPIRGGQALLISTTARANRRDAQLCPASGGCQEVRLSVTNRLFQAYPAAYIGDQAAHAWWLEHVDEFGRELVWQVPLSPGDASVLTLSPALAGDRCPWQFVDAELDGAELDASFPSARIELPAGGEGRVFVAREWGQDLSCLSHGAFAPPIVETDPSWTRLRALLDGA